MKLTTQVQRAVDALVALARSGSKMTTHEICEAAGVPFKYAEVLIARLRRAGLVESRRGSKGGYTLAQPADEITFRQIVECCEGPILPVPPNATGAVAFVHTYLRVRITQFADGTTLAELSEVTETLASLDSEAGTET